MKIALLSALLFFVFESNAQVAGLANEKNNSRSISSPFANKKLSFEAISIEKGITVNEATRTWGFKIFVDNKIYLQQTSKPGKSNKEGFSTKRKAEKCAEIIIHKLKLGLPVSLSEKELLEVESIQ